MGGGNGITNYEKIKAMSLDELAIEICKSHERCDNCRYSQGCKVVGDGMRKWLESEASIEEKTPVRNRGAYPKKRIRGGNDR